MKVSQAVKVNNTELEHHDRAGHVLAVNADGSIDVKIDREDDPIEFQRADLIELG